MAKIKITGYYDLIEVSQDRAKKIQEIWKDNDFPNSHKLTIENISITKGDIKAIFLDSISKEQGDFYKGKLREYYEKRRGLLSLSPDERANKIGWGIYTLFYWGLRNEKPDTKTKGEVLRKIAQFYEENMDWAKPRLKVLAEIAEMKQDDVMDKAVFKILERVEVEELNAIKQDKEYSKRIQEQDKREEESLRDIEINIEDLNF